MIRDELKTVGLNKFSPPLIVILSAFVPETLERNVISHLVYRPLRAIGRFLDFRKGQEKMKPVGLPFFVI
jgi:hypothetical protein